MAYRGSQLTSEQELKYQHEPQAPKTVKNIEKILLIFPKKDTDLLPNLRKGLKLVGNSATRIKVVSMSTANTFSFSIYIPGE